MLAQKEQRLVAAGCRDGRLFTHEGDMIIFLESGKGTSREGALRLPEGEGEDRRT